MDTTKEVLKALASQAFLGLSHSSVTFEADTRENLSKTTDDFKVEHAHKLEKLRCLFTIIGQNVLESLLMIDALQRLGIDYHFQGEIKAFLEKQYKKQHLFDGHQDHSLHMVALCFRLLRQEGHFVPADVFRSFMSEGDFKEVIRKDMNGLINLYEASHLSTGGESILDQAKKFSSQALRDPINKFDSHNEVQNTLECPYRISVTKLLSRHYMTKYQGTNKWIYVLQDMARIDFKIVQSMHKKEIEVITAWWKNLGLANELNMARNQPLKWHCWSIGCITDPMLSDQRLDLTKPISLVYCIDDIFDLYGTLDDLTLLTKAVHRWDPAAAEQLPEYMKSTFRALLSITNEISNKVFEAHGWNPIGALKKAWARLCDAFLVEANWLALEQLPPANVYLENAIISSGVPLVLLHLFFILGGTNENDKHYIDHAEGIVYSTAMILRLCDDLGTAEDEDQDGRDGSYIQCYMKDHQGDSEDCARQHVLGLISNAWKCLNKEYLAPHSYPASFVNACLNVARMSPLMYSGDKNQIKEHLGWLLHGDFPAIKASSFK